MPAAIPPPQVVAIVGGGPAGLMAAEVLATAGARAKAAGGGPERALRVELFDAMPTVGRKFLLAGKGGLNLTHSEPPPAFLARYGPRRAELAPLLADFGPDALRAWARGLGIETFVGSSGRVFPAGMQAAPLLRAWLRRLRAAGLRFHMRHRWLGWADGAAHTLRFATPRGEARHHADLVVLALGGGSWSRLGSDGAWVPLLRQAGVDVTPLRPSNCGFDVAWSERFRSRFAGAAVKTVALSFAASSGEVFQQPGEFVVTETGVEGGLIYAASALLRDELAAQGRAVAHVDLAPDRSLTALADRAARPRGSRSLSNHLRSRLGLDGVKAALLHEGLSHARPPGETPREVFADARRLAQAIKALPLVLVAPRPLDEAISSAGGVRFEALDEGLMLRARPGVFCAGEMLDWEAPTGGYLLTACFASGVAAAQGALAHRARGARAGEGQ
jgi:uncharacterized flavoprotein (TIGR03862 family)